MHGKSIVVEIINFELFPQKVVLDGEKSDGIIHLLNLNSILSANIIIILISKQIIPQLSNFPQKLINLTLLFLDNFP